VFWSFLLFTSAAATTTTSRPHPFGRRLARPPSRARRPSLALTAPRAPVASRAGRQHPFWCPIAPEYLSRRALHFWFFHKKIISQIPLGIPMPFIVLFFDPRQYGHASGNAPPWPPATPSGAVNTCNWSHCATATDPRRLARLRARVSTPFSQTVRMVFERQLALPAALRQSCSEEFEHRPTG
jgi:hypothetical protein